MQALILAAGQGSRLRPLTCDRPKGCVNVCGASLLYWQVDALQHAGIDDFAVVTGYRGEIIDEFSTVFENTQWQFTNMLYSLSLAEPWLSSETTVVSYSDILYRDDTVKAVIDHPGDIVIAYDPNWLSLWQARFEDPLSDAESFQLNDRGELTAIGDKCEDLEEIQGQYMGLFKVTPQGWKTMATAIENLPLPQLQNISMSEFLAVLLKAGVTIHCCKNLFPWYEIDSMNDLQYATLHWLPPENARVEDELEQGISCHQSGDWEAAKMHYQRILNKAPRHAETQHLFGVLALQCGDAKAACEAIHRAIGLTTHDPLYFNHLALAYQVLEDLSTGIEILQYALLLDPDFPDVYYNLGRIYHCMGNQQAAEQAYLKTLSYEPNNVGAINNLGIVAMQRGELTHAQEQFEKAIQLEPENVEVLNNLGNVYKTLEEYKKSELAYLKALNISQGCADLYFNLGNLKLDCGEIEEAERYFQQVLQLNPDDLNAYRNLGIALNDQNEFAKAIDCFHHVLSMDEMDIKSYCYLGDVYIKMRDYQQAFESYSSGLAISREDPELHLHLALLYLRLGQFSEGWQHYVYRHNLSFEKTDWVFPPCADADLSHKVVYVSPDLRLGETFLMTSCLDDLARVASRVIMACDPRLQKTLRRSFPTIEFLDGDLLQTRLNSLPDDTCQLPLMDLPMVFRNDLADFPRKQGHIVPDPILVTEWRKRLSCLGEGLYVGIAWRSQSLTMTKNRDFTAFQAWREILKLEGIHFINLQCDDCEEELADIKSKFGVTIHHYGDLDLTNDLENTMALSAALDLVIAPDTCTFMLAAAVGVPTWMFTQYAGLWEMHGCDYLPYMPSARLFLQSSPGDWSSVFTDIKNGLAALQQQYIGIYAYQQGKALVALEAFKKQIHIEPQRPEGYINLGKVLQSNDQLEDAVKVYQQALHYDPLNPVTLSNLASVYRKLGRLDQAAEAASQSLALNPVQYDALRNLGVITGELRCFGESCDYFKQLISANHDDPKIHRDYSFSLLSLGNLNLGWQEYEWRLRCPPHDRKWHFKSYDGQGFANRTLLLSREQGVGEELFFSACLPAIADDLEKGIVECDPRLKTLLMRSFPGYQFVSKEELQQLLPSLPHNTQQLPIGSLPQHLVQTVDDLPLVSDYLKPVPARVQHWQNRLAQLGQGKKIGVCWRSGFRNSVRDHFYPDMEHWRPLFTMDNVHWINIQYGDVASELQAIRDSYGVELYQPEGVDLKNDFEEMSAIYSACDAIVSVSTASFNLAGALGVPCYLLLPSMGIWQQLGTDRLPWFSSVKVFRQHKLGDWQPVMDAVASEVRR